MSLKKVLTDASEQLLKMLKEKLPAELTYHTFGHTMDVVEAAERIAKAENVSDDDLLIVRTAAVFHDSGYMISRENHELKSCMIARELLSSKGADEETIERVCTLILATKIPHEPKDKLSEIICDADLDYLGRDDYFPISQTVFDEFRHFGVVTNKEDWKQMQLKFLGSHRYFTKTSNEDRQEKKMENLKKIKEDFLEYKNQNNN
jgi:uncharacterized protein